LTGAVPMSFRLYRSAAALVLVAAAASPALAQRVIHMVVPFGPGAVQDTIARTFNAELGQALGATVVVENRPGAGGTVGTAQVAKATDNNTLVLAAASHTLAGHLYSKLDYDPIKNFTGVAFVGNTGYVIAAPGNLGVNTLADYVKLLKGKQGLAGRVQGVTSALIGITAFKQDPRIKLLAYTGPQRSKFMPELPTVAEGGVPGYKFDSWIGVLAPSTMPRAEVDRLNVAINKVLADPAVQERLGRLGVETGSMQVDAFQQLLKADYDAAGVLVKASGARIE
jgi:tripartite-type tricarboxylate transporter receptor subunit TctC